MDDLQEPELIRRCLKGEVECFSQLVQRYETMVRTMVARLIKDEQSVDEVAHQVFIQAYEKLDKFEGRSKFSTWLGQIALNKGRDFLRRRRVERERFVDSEIAVPLASHTPGPMQEASACQDCGLLQRALAGLNEKDRNVIIMRYMNEYDFGTIAGLVQSTPDAVKVRSFRATAKLRQELNRMGVAP